MRLGCPDGKYGTDCSKECGNCRYPPCNAVTGECPVGECLDPFTGSQCKIRMSSAHHQILALNYFIVASLPVLLHPPQIVDIGYTSITVTIGNSSYDGKVIPAYYKIQYEIDNVSNTLLQSL